MKNYSCYPSQLSLVINLGNKDLVSYSKSLITLKLEEKVFFKLNKESKIPNSFKKILLKIPITKRQYEELILVLKDSDELELYFFNSLTEFNTLLKNLYYL